MAGAVDDREIAARELVAAGDLKAAATLLVRGYGPEIHGFLVAHLRDETAAADVFSVFAEDLWRGLPGFRGLSSLRVWAYALAKNAAARHLAAPHRRRARNVPLSQADELAELADAVRTETLPYLRTEAKSKLAELRERLSPDERALLVLRVDRGLDWIDVARILSSSTAEGYELLAFEDEGCERIMTRAHAVRRPQDLAKLRMAALDGDPVAPLIASVVPGILSIPLPSSDVVDAFAAGPRLGIAAAVGTAGDAERFQWTKVVDGITRMPVVCASGALVLRSSAYEKLAADERQAVDDASLRFEEILAPRLRKEDTAASLHLLRSLSAAEPSVDDRAAWQRAFRHAAEQTDGSLPKAMVTQVLALSGEIDALH